MKSDRALTAVAPNSHDGEERSGFYAGIVLYRPGNQHHIESIRTLLSCGINVILFDNSEDEETRRNNTDLLKQVFVDRLRYLESDQGNIGLSVAYNRIVHEVTTDSLAKGVFFFDQDTEVNIIALEYLMESFGHLQAKGQLGIVSGYAVRENGIPYRVRPRPAYPSPSQSLIAVDVTSSSFSLIPITTLATLGNFQDDFFIDYIDCDFCHRCWQHNLPVFVDTRAAFLHRVGLGDVYIGNKPLFPIAAPFRHYYQVRNMILSYSRANLPKFDLVRQIAMRIAVIFVIGIYTRSLFQRLKYTARGIIDGIKGTNGRLL